MTSAQRKILLVDDQQIVLQLAGAVLRSGGYAVRTANSVAELDALISQWIPDMILTDVSMPGMTGDMMCKMLKARYETAHVPIVLFSSLPPQKLEILAQECEADGFLTKINGLDHLLQDLGELCDLMLW